MSSEQRLRYDMPGVWLVHEELGPCRTSEGFMTFEHVDLRGKMESSPRSTKGCREIPQASEPVDVCIRKGRAWRPEAGREGFEPSVEVFAPTSA